MEEIKVNELHSLGKNLSENFYHYTSANALQNIIETSTLRFTHCGFLNDMDEYNFVFELLDEVIQDKTNAELSDWISNTTGLITKDIIGVYTFPKSKWFLGCETGEYYILSGSNQPDSISMWNYYSKSANYFGYSIKLNTYEIARSLSACKGVIYIGNIIYNKDSQKRIFIQKLSELKQTFEEECKEYGGDEPAISNFQENFNEFIQWFRLFIKRDGFAHEEEIRIVLLINKKDPDFKLKFSTVNGIMRPYIEREFKHRVPIEKIIMSPTIEEKTGEMGLKWLLDKYGYTSKDVISKSTLRLRF